LEFDTVGRAGCPDVRNVGALRESPEARIHN
jgi:hypothetical protein